MVLLVLTCPRPLPRLAMTLQALDAQSWVGDRIVWSDGPIDASAIPGGWEVVSRPRIGPPNTHPYFDAVSVCQGHDVLVIEDDVDVVPGALRYIQRAGVPEGLAYVSWFDPICRMPVSVPAVRFFPASEIVPCQARTIPSASIDIMIEYRASSSFDAELGADGAMASAFAGMLAAIHVPSLFQHVGSASVVRPGADLSGPRTSETYRPTLDVSRAFAHVDPARLMRLPQRM